MMGHGEKIFTVLLVLLMFTLLSAQTNILTNPGVETREPNFWHTMNDGLGGAACIWATDTAVAPSQYSFKIEKPSTTTDAVGWQSDNNAKLYWNNAGSGTYTLHFQSKTEGVNTNPANDDARIGVLYKFSSGGNLLAEQFVPIDQSAASSNWESNESVLLVSGEPDEVIAELVMGKDATGTVWFDNVDCGTDPWTMGVFNADAETPVGWMYWTDGGKIGFANVVGDTAYDGNYSVLLEEDDDQDDEMVFYSEPVPAEAGKWYMLSVWMKTEGVNTDTSWFATRAIPDFDQNRAGVCFFFHKDPIETNWDLVGGDQFFYVDQSTGRENQGWTHYVVVAQAPEEAAGVSVRARFNNYAMGKVWYDDFAVEELQVGSDIMVNGGVETRAPGFWSKMNDGLNGASCTWASDTAATPSQYSFKIEKPSTTTDAVGWQSDNNAKLYWNNAGSGTYTLRFQSKTEGVNTNPANDDAKIGVLYKFSSGGNLLAEQFVPIDQSAANSNWESNESVLLVSGEPDEVIVEPMMGKDATGTVWFDNVDCGTDPWTMGVFTGDAETPVGWMYWTDGGKIGFANVVDDTVYDGSYSVLLEEDDNQDDEMVFYSAPMPAEAGKWYMIGVWMKTNNVNTGNGWLPTNGIPDFDQNRGGVCFFYHKDPIQTNWDLVGGDQFFYVDQREEHATEDWTHYIIVSQAPEEAAGVSVRARFNNYMMGKVWYDDFTIQEVTPMITALEEPSNVMNIAPNDYILKNNYPNPFNPLTVIEYIVPKNGNVNLTIYNVLGQKVKVLVDKEQMTGTHRVMWNGTDEAGRVLPSGMYFYQLRGDNALITKRMTFIK